MFSTRHELLGWDERSINGQVPLGLLFAGAHFLLGAAGEQEENGLGAAYRPAARRRLHWELQVALASAP
jgi:hypothetical protein